MGYAAHLKVAKRIPGGSSLLPNLAVVSLLLCLAGVTTSCGSLPSQSGGSSASATALSLSPNGATVASQEQLQFIARISGSPNTAVIWAASAGTISSDGVFTAPTVTNNTPVTITATSANHSVTGSGKNADSTTGDTQPSGPLNGTNTNAVNAGSHASATVIVTAPSSVAITTSALPVADVSSPYAASLSATGGIAPYKWSLATGVLPSGIQLQATSGVISGITAATGSYPVTARVTDASGHTATAALHLTVSTGSASGFDGPAELPRVYIQSALSNTPVAGSTITVNAGGDLQSALNSASCGETIQLQAGATFAGVFTFPAKSCDDNHWIVVRSSAADSTLPAEGSRLTPCYAGVAALPGRPAFSCASTKNVLAKLIVTAANNGPILFASGANHYRLIGLEITRAAGSGGVTALASIVSGGTANNLIFDRVWMHGTAQDDTTRGIWLEGGTYVSVVDSFLTDFHCVALTGACGDSQAIAGGVGSGAMGPYKIAGNFLEASGENILFGGDSATTTPADIELSRNHFFKPFTWMKGQAGYVGGANGNPFVAKNLLELKNAQRVLVDGNIMENSWGGFSQVGFAILITPKNQSGSNGSNICPICQVTDVTIRNTSISHVGAGLQIANALSDNGGPALDGQRYSIHDLVVDDINGLKYNGPSEFAQVSVSAGAPILQYVSISHVTAFPPSFLFVIGDDVATSTPMKNFVFTNSIVNAGTYPVWSTGGGAANCAYYDVPLTTFAACFIGSFFANNAIIAPPSVSSTVWPSKNFFPGSTAAAQFVNYNGGNGGDYRLLSSSPYKGKGTDGKDLGADMDAVNSAIAGVQ
jgi:Putative Ig domain